MATRSTITLSNADNYDSIYCHWDGAPSHNGQILLEHYDTEEKVKELIALGSISSLNKYVKPAVGDKHSFCHPAKNVTVAYHRDRGEGIAIAKYHSLYQVYEEGEEYNYMFEEGQWYLVTKKDGHIEPVLLRDIMLASA